MNEFHGTAVAHVLASPRDTFDLITNIDRLPEWNKAIRRIVERPATLTPGAEWVVVMRPPGLPPWKSRSHLQEIEPGTRFSYRSHSDDNNPSYTLWQWDLTPTADGTRITLSWDGYPKTSFRRALAAPLRSRMLKHEAAESLDQIRGVLEHSTIEARETRRAI